MTTSGRAADAAARGIVVVGASLAGLRAAEELRRLGFDGPLTMIGAEHHLPYDRPPLSKELLAGSVEPEAIALRRQPYDALGLELRLGVRATRLDVAQRVVHTDDGFAVHFAGVVVATGAAPREIPNPAGLDGVYVLRTVDDALALRTELDARPRVVVVGAGFIGAEVAATCRNRGLDVTMLEALPTPMARGLAREIGDVLGEMHRDHGVDLRLGTGVAGFEGATRVERVRLDDGTAVEADVVVVGIGVVPNSAWLDDSGLTIANGLVCDETLCAAPGVVGAGDVVRWPNPAFAGVPMRLEHWTNATEQGVAAAARLLATGDEVQPFSSVPFVWSDQYDVKIQVAGHVQSDDTVEIVDGSLEERRFVAVCGRDGRLTGVVAFSRPRLLMQYRRLIVEGASFDDALAFARR